MKVLMPENECPWCGNERQWQEDYREIGLLLPSQVERWLKCRHCWIMWIEGAYYYYDRENTFSSISMGSWIRVPAGCLIIKDEVEVC